MSTPSKDNSFPVPAPDPGRSNQGDPNQGHPNQDDPNQGVQGEDDFPPPPPRSNEKRASTPVLAREIFRSEIQKGMQDVLSGNVVAMDLDEVMESVRKSVDVSPEERARRHDLWARTVKAISTNIYPPEVLGPLVGVSPARLYEIEESSQFHLETDEWQDLLSKIPSGSWPKPARGEVADQKPALR